MKVAVLIQKLASLPTSISVPFVLSLMSACYEQPLERAENVLRLREEWALNEFLASRSTLHFNNGDRSSAASFHKTLPHDEFGQVRPLDPFTASPMPHCCNAQVIQHERLEMTIPHSFVNMMGCQTGCTNLDDARNSACGNRGQAVRPMRMSRKETIKFHLIHRPRARSGCRLLKSRGFDKGLTRAA